MIRGGTSSVGDDVPSEPLAPISGPFDDEGGNIDCNGTQVDKKRLFHVKG